MQYISQHGLHSNKDVCDVGILGTLHDETVPFFKTNKPCSGSPGDTFKVYEIENGKNTTNSRFTHWWVVHQNTIFMLIQICGYQNTQSIIKHH